MELDTALAFVGARHNGVLTTLRANGRPQLSNIAYALGDDGIIRISITDERAKAKDLRRDPRASLYVVGDTFWSYAVLEGTTELTAVAADPSDGVVDELISLFRQVQGEHPDWNAYREAMVKDHRLVVRFAPAYAYGMLGG
jgi:PPOX class probable F420-dependent enzyme